MRILWAVPFVMLGLTGSPGCGKPQPPAGTAQGPLTVAAAANLTDAFKELAQVYRAKTGGKVVLVYGSTAQLAAQCESAAPFDVFAAADTEHIDALIQKAVVFPHSRAVYARGRVALWMPKGEASGVNGLADLVKPEVRVISIATPGVAPYGAAAVESLKNAGVWAQVEKKVVYANNINMSKQFASTGNADAAFTAYSLVLHERGKVIQVEERLHHKLEQALGILQSSRQQESAQKFRTFVLGPDGRAVLQKFGYELP